MRTVKLSDFIEEAKRRFGDDSRKWKFKCPQCKTVQSAEDLVAAGVSKDDVERFVGFSCIGRFKEGVGCDWTLGGLFQIHEIEIEDEDGKMHRHFELAEYVRRPPQG